ncbi:PQQ-binding-like beta-propeller repeat protein [Rhodococcus sp. NPDC057297]|uniref:Rv3212 family protein n=1 Tax=Rhodococcus sp. NPDC057297 TaxID=3346090 RepID=UPI003640EC0B
MLAPERRRRSDLVAAATILVVAVLAAGVIWFRSDAHGTTSETAPTPLPQATTALAVPASLTEVWRAQSPLTSTPVVTGSAVVSGDDGGVNGLDPSTGETAWSYRRDVPLCAVTSAWNTAVAVFADDRGCAQVTELDGATGSRKAQRSSDADSEVRLSDDGTYVTSLGDTRMELWRSDLVRTLEYGRVDAPQNPGTQPRTGCTLLSTASNSSRVAVLEQCPEESGARLTTMNPAPKDATEPQEYGSSVVASLTSADGPVDGARVLIASGDRVALSIPSHSGEPAKVALFDGNAQPLTEFDLPDGTVPEVSADLYPTVVKSANVFSWWTGSSTVALDLSDLSPQWTVPGALGPGTLMAGRLLLPVQDGTAVIDPSTGTAERTIPVDRGDYSGPVGLAVVGDVLIEQRGTDLVALSGTEGQTSGE